MRLIGGQRWPRGGRSALVNYIHDGAIMHAHDGVAVQLKGFNPIYDAAFLELGHLWIILLLQLFQSVPLNLKVCQRLPVHDVWSQRPTDLGV